MEGYWNVVNFFGAAKRWQGRNFILRTDGVTDAVMNDGGYF